MHKALFATAISLFFSLIITAKPALAADCTMIYGGGEIKCDNPISPTLTPQNPKDNVGTQTKGGLNVQKPANVSKTPATGPEAFGLISLIPMAAAGFWLTRKTNN